MKHSKSLASANPGPPPPGMANEAPHSSEGRQDANRQMPVQMVVAHLIQIFTISSHSEHDGGQEEVPRSIRGTMHHISLSPARKYIQSIWASNALEISVGAGPT